MMKNKFLLIFPLVILLILLLLYSHLEFTDNDYPNGGYLFEQYQRFNNTEICFRAQIYEINQTNHTILATLVDYPHSFVEITTQSIDPQLKKEDTIFVVGVLKGEKTVSANKILVKGLMEDAIIFISSIPAIPFVLYLFFRTWRFNRRTFSFERREKHA